jgi:hypothetical protein
MAVPVGDPIAQLPIDQTPLTPSEIQIIDTLFKKHPSTMEIIGNESRDVILVAILVIVCLLPQLNSLIYKVFSTTENSPYILMLAKGVVAAVLYWLIKHFYLGRKHA